MTDATYTDVTAWKRFWSKVDKSDGCWLWTAAKTRDGYGAFRFEGRVRMAHRVAYIMLVGPIETSTMLDHMCHNADRTCRGNAECKHRACVNPSHFAFADHRLNALRSPLLGAMTHCRKGHEFTPENTYITPSNSRFCRTCQRANDKRRQPRRKVRKSGQ